NLKTAVKKILVGRNRIEQESFVAMRAHFVFNSNFCNTNAGNEKGQIEGLVGFARRNFLVPVPDVSTLEELNELLEQECLEYAGKTRVPHTSELIATAWEKEKEHLLPIPNIPFDACRIVEGQVDKQSLIHFETNAYSVPCEYVGQKVLIKAYADEIKVAGSKEIIAVHKRCFGRYQQILELEHYIDALAQKPRAVRDAAVMQTGRVPAIYRDFQHQMNMRYGANGDREFIRILFLHRKYGSTVISQALEHATALNMYRYEAVSELVRRLVNPEEAPLPLPKEQIDPALRDYAVAKPELNKFDQLLPKGGVFH
ncbi:MAG: Mu transposase domain-containing protein, partial [Bacillota bacterium]